VAACHQHGVPLGGIDSSACRVDKRLALRLSPAQCLARSSWPQPLGSVRVRGGARRGWGGGSVVQGKGGERGLLPGLLPAGWHRYQLVQAWSDGGLSTLDYLMTLNTLAGRRMGDSNFHPILPWVIDMTCAPDSGAEVGTVVAGWRDLRQSKVRLTRGDEQVFSYAYAACVCACMHACMHACARARVRVHTHAHVHTYMHACMHAYIHTYIHTYTEIHRYIQAHEHTHAHTHTHTHTHTSRKFIHACVMYVCMYERVRVCARARAHAHTNTHTSRKFIQTQNSFVQR